MPFLLLIAIVLGSIYGGLATPTEAGAVGVVGAVLIAGLYGRLSPGHLAGAVARTAAMSGNILFVVFIAMILPMRRRSRTSARRWSRR